MQISNAMDTATDHIIDAKNRLKVNANAIASMHVHADDHSSLESSLDAKPKALSETLVENLQIEYEVKASSLVIKTADEILGTLLNTRA